MTIVFLFAGLFALKAAAIYFEKDALIRKSQAFSVFTPDDVGFSGAFYKKRSRKAANLITFLLALRSGQPESILISMSPSPHVHLQEWDKNSPSGCGPAVFCSGSFRTNGLCKNMFSLILIHLFPDPCGNFCYV